MNVIYLANYLAILNENFGTSVHLQANNKIM